MKHTLSRNRRAVLISGITLLACLTAGCRGDDGKPSESDPGGMGETLTGRSITAYMGNSPAAEAIRSLLPEFEARTGLKVDLTSFTNEQLSQKLSVQFAAGSSSPDVFMTRPLEEVKSFGRHGWLQPLDKYVANDSNYDFADFSRTVIESVTYGGKIAAMPLSTEQQILFYRKDLLAQAGLPVPQTMDELEAAAKVLHDPAGGVFGFVARGQRNALVTQLSSFLYSEGGDFQVGGKAAINTPEAIRGISRYVTLLKRYGPPGVFNIGWQQAAGLFSQGKAAFYTDASAIYSIAMGSNQSSIADNVGIAMFPAGQAGSKPFNVTAWGLGMNAGSTRKDAAWLFIRWATSKEVVMKSQQMGNPGARTSVWNDPQGVTGFPSEYISVVMQSMRVGVGHDRPQVVQVGQARDIIGDIVIQGLLDEDITAAADKANREFQALIDRENVK
ncbi:ABC transporter substrate-binding protein [Paenibacillus ginsengarvi]|uniref:Sugar ABC transporter substrate-binding protein n=1 Tax=Paenibacillus ginsengarvi TaxID=400777 RepID=A0A3B0CDE9_9BACL|nr:sugar ABC transporter substrate-binding protein [Paenibacillus ginsengarvi]RKN81927.1 sugar ABC transporter substrate-binding protein [Paenibacillus ginsengarvi]